jgi:ATP-dependent Clp protease ATP-binding subunit ClpC
MMPKINVYVPDELAEAVKTAGIPVSAVCQRALEAAVRRVTAIREAVAGPALDLEDESSSMTNFTERARAAVKVAVTQARALSSPEVRTEHLLAGLIADGGTVALQVLLAIDIEPGRLSRELDRVFASQPTVQDAPVAPPADPRFDTRLAAALELAVTEAISFNHNYVGSEHLLLGLVAEPDGTAGRILRGLGADLRLTRRAVAAALAGYYLHAQQGRVAQPALADPMIQLSAMVDEQLKPVIERLSRIEGSLRL